MNLKKELIHNKIFLIVVNSDKYDKQIIRLFKDLQDNKICYLNANRGCDYLINFFNKKKIKTENVTFVDCITKSIVQPKKIKGCIFVDSINGLTDMGIKLGNELKQNKFIVIDSLRTFLVYHKVNMFMKLMYTLINKIRINSLDTSLIMVIDNKKTRLYKEIKAVADKVIVLE